MAAPGYGYGIVAMVAPGYGGPWCVYVCMHVCNKINASSLQTFDLTPKNIPPPPVFYFSLPPNFFQQAFASTSQGKGRGRETSPHPQFTFFAMPLNCSSRVVVVSMCILLTAGISPQRETSQVYTVLNWFQHALHLSTFIRSFCSSHCLVVSSSSLYYTT